jgi:hypothetical protein
MQLRMLSEMKNNWRFQEGTYRATSGADGQIWTVQEPLQEKQEDMDTEPGGEERHQEVHKSHSTVVTDYVEGILAGGDREVKREEQGQLAV